MQEIRPSKVLTKHTGFENIPTTKLAHITNRATLEERDSPKFDLMYDEWIKRVHRTFTNFRRYARMVRRREKA